MLDWVPLAGRRRVGRPVRRWGDDLQAFGKSRGEDWKRLAQHRENWAGLEDGFVEFAQAKG